ncbi:hypothetical protein BDW59DRAFT_155083 [Aspergillus cavernicola]|uniref:Uncharacterized protein n=1 Tax=Aspergillus cavernicola TaxID=176166 RepID=A0ABR4HC57_9EURO
MNHIFTSLSCERSIRIGRFQIRQPFRIPHYGTLALQKSATSFLSTPIEPEAYDILAYKNERGCR